MAKFTVCFRLVCNGAVTVEAEDNEAAVVLVAAMDDATLAQSAQEDCEREFVSVEEAEIEAVRVGEDMARYQIVFMDGGDGWALGDLVEGRVRDGELHTSEDGEDTVSCPSTRGDGLFQNEDGDVLYVPVPA